MSTVRFTADALRDGFEHLEGRLLAIAYIADYAGPLVKCWESVLEDGNRRGVLTGLDKDDKPAPQLHGGPVGTAKKLSVAQRPGQHPNRRRGRYAGRGEYEEILANNNLPTRELAKLAGPYAAPRRQFSRLITNLTTGSGRDPSDPKVWRAGAAWVEVVIPKGQPILHMIFDGTDTLNPYDLRGIRAEEKAEMWESFRAWAKLEIRKRWDNGG